MGPLYDLTTRDGIAHTIDLRRIVAVEKSAEADCSTFYMDPADDDLCLDDDVADPLTEAWRVCGGDAIYRVIPLPSVESKFVDLRRISRTATARTGIVTAYTDPSDHSFSLHPSAGGPLLSAWHAYRGPHTPAEPVGVPQLPKGWAIYKLDDGSTAAVNLRDRMRCSARGHDPVSVATDGSHSYVDADVIVSLIAAHRARGGA